MVKRALEFAFARRIDGRFALNLAVCGLGLSVMYVYSECHESSPRDRAEMRFKAHLIRWK